MIQEVESNSLELDAEGVRKGEADDWHARAFDSFDPTA
ncbi:MAG: hypothetical protein ACI841_002202 [Planctomycetota bacterium]|jgi:hypothetical protein